MATAAPAIPDRAPASPLVITLVVMLGTFMTVLDSTIANVALPHMQPSLGAASDTISWVLTSYIVATAIATPVTGWLAAKIGRRQLFLYSVAGFTIASMACGVAQSLEQMVLFRMVQGAAGAFLAPLGQSYVLDVWPQAKHGKAMAWWGVGIMVGPILGPVIGGWLTESFDWRWVFFINLPFGILTFLWAAAVLPRVESAARRFDLLGFGLLAVGVGALQLCLDRGQQLDWFASWEVCIEAGIAAAALWAFGVHVMTANNALIDRRMLKDRNVMTGFAFITLVGLLLVGTTALLPTMLQNLFGYPVIATGMLQMPRGIGMMMAMMGAGQILGHVDARALIAGGLVMSAVSMWLMMQFSPVMDATPFMVSGFLQGAGLGLIFVPLNTLAFATLPPDLRTDAAGFYMLLRNLGGSIGISLTVGVLARQAQISHADLGSHLTTAGVPWADAGLGKALGSDAIVAMLDATVNKQAAMIAYLDVFTLMFWITIASMPLLLLLRRPKMAGPAVHLAD
ncbi:DHA2 family efflux MFS transporter permease subunit [Polymorphobacter fuscus]|uniref:DHA2 family efflux MFS transporter permease subunit n=1 Tax=Sandarakinorhabdus fusca TaxID=1439888 RepID=A0A7C9KG44_9SPHN|nr:DHA2 family efflux MFS transporter permease subunit [Polymorphobacter fuscus]KAB7648291.1 DHA2 family efflux MFS transporter permease subunit [Polymorphobacter fuscus]MQT15800.1 DHA2 family efflux MFS transporter permease subunit [Polymorphobacter fuscus]